MRQSIACLMSAFVGGIAALVFVEDRHIAPLEAQSRGPRFPGLEDRSDGRDDLLPEERVNVAIYEQVNKSVVHITSRGTRVDNFFFLETQEGAGSGSILDKSGHILTNYHVIEGAREVNVGLHDGSSYSATLVGADPISDIAVLKIDAPAEQLHPLVMGDSTRLKVGMKVYAIGNPFGLERTMATGIISSLNRSLQLRGERSVRSIIQIDAAVNPGNSGGPLLDSRGRLIGITTAIASKNGQSAGVGFAIPVSLVARVAPQLLQHGRVIRPESGIRKVYETDQGLLVASLAPGGPAELAGLRGPQVNRQRRGPFVIERVDRLAADIITGVDGERVERADDLLTYLDSKRPGDRIRLEVLRNKQKIEIEIQLGGGTESR
jgi:S1-C subfamily serine protease